MEQSTEGTVDKSGATTSADTTDAVAAAAPEKGVVTLVDGRTARVRPGYTKDMLRAARVASDEASVQFALIAVLTTIDGEALLFEDLLELPIADFEALYSEVNRAKRGKAR